MSTDPSHDQRAARSFGEVAAAYDRGRPSYPTEVARWLVGDAPVRVLEVGAGTGKLTATLAALGHDVHATDPDEQMLQVLRRALPDVEATQAAAEDLPFPDASFDVVVCAQAFHWFDRDRALPEISRVLVPHGRLSLVWNHRDERIPWVRRLGRIIGTQDRSVEPAADLASSALFDEAETFSHTFWQHVDRASIQDLVLSRSAVAVLDEEGRAAKLAEVLALYDDYGRGMDGMQLPYVARCWRAEALDRVTPTLTSAGSVAEDSPAAQDVTADAPDASVDGADGADGADDTDEARAGSTVSDGSSTDMLLIDFR